MSVGFHGPTGRLLRKHSSVTSHGAHGDGEIPGIAASVLLRIQHSMMNQSWSHPSSQTHTFAAQHGGATYSLPTPARHQNQKKKNTCAERRMWCNVKSRVLIYYPIKARKGRSKSSSQPSNQQSNGLKSLLTKMIANETTIPQANETIAPYRFVPRRTPHAPANRSCSASSHAARLPPPLPPGFVPCLSPPAATPARPCLPPPLGPASPFTPHTTHPTGRPDGDGGGRTPGAEGDGGGRQHPRPDGDCGGRTHPMGRPQAPDGEGGRRRRAEVARIQRGGRTATAEAGRRRRRPHAPDGDGGGRFGLSVGIPVILP
jgi:hypothetical protein